METRSMTKRKKLEEADVPVVRNTTTISDLPDDCFSSIFVFLPVEDRLRLPAVCRRWKGLISTIFRSIKKLDLIRIEKLKDPYDYELTNKGMDIDFLEQYGNERKGLTLRYSKLPLRFVKVLAIPMASGSGILRRAVDRCENLRKVIIRCDDFVANRAEHCRDIGRLFEENRTTLRSVIIDNMGERFADHAACLSKLPEELVELQLWGYKARFSRSVESEVTRSFERLMRELPILKNLQILVLNGIRISSVKLTMLQNFDDLRYLEMYRSTRFDLVAFDIKPISSRRKLEYLSLERVENLDTHWFAELVENNPNLKHLKLQACKLEPEFIVQLFASSKLETLSLTSLDLDPERINLSGFSNLKKFVCTTAGDRAVIDLMEVAAELRLINLCRSSISSVVLDKANEIANNRTNNVPLHIVVEGDVIEEWQRPERTSPLLTVESSEDFYERTHDGYEGNEEEIYY